MDFIIINLLLVVVVVVVVVMMMMTMMMLMMMLMMMMMMMLMMMMIMIMMMMIMMMMMMMMIIIIMIKQKGENSPSSIPLQACTTRFISPIKNTVSFYCLATSSIQSHYKIDQTMVGMNLVRSIHWFEASTNSIVVQLFRTSKRR